MKNEFKTTEEAYNAGKKAGFIEGFMKAASFIVKQIEIMQDKIKNQSKKD